VRQAGFDWTIRRAKVRYATGPATEAADYGVIDDKHVLLRSDSLKPLSIVSDGYKIVQPAEVLEFFRDLTTAAGFQMETAGVLHDGKKFWALARMGETASIVGNDLVRAYLMLATSCDGSMQTLAANVAERVVCANTLGVAMDERGNRKVKVSHRSTFDADAVKRQMGVCVPNFLKFVNEAREMARRIVSPVEAERFVASMVEQPHIETARDMAGFKSIMSLFQGGGKGSQLPGVKGTAWGLVNAVTEFADHHARARSQSNRLDSAWFGAGDDMKARAHVEALKLAA